MFDIVYYSTADGKQICKEWLLNLKDERAATKISLRFERLQKGNFGDYKPLGKSLYELRIDEGQGYRIYYALDGKKIVVLLCGGDKRTQSKDIKRAYGYLEDYKNA